MSSPAPRFSMSDSDRQADIDAGFAPIAWVVTEPKLYLYQVGRYWVEPYTQADHTYLLEVMSVDGFQPALLPGCEHASSYYSTETLLYDTIAQVWKVLATWQDGLKRLQVGDYWAAGVVAPGDPEPSFGDASPGRDLHGMAVDGLAPSAGALYDELIQFGPIEGVSVSVRGEDGEDDDEDDDEGGGVEWVAHVRFCHEESAQALEFEMEQRGKLGPFVMYGGMPWRDPSMNSRSRITASVHLGVASRRTAISASASASDSASE
ncbi:uncharacterized protein LOC62_07G009771 [Vanrija pseudolonga]|uniref:Uncharacterized protein n=1 Tax=Vanrija pseudolonga TaxID=143232 RepID=A0AAF0YGE0_9TREE|nr:hypothetical protein LOC62_07G009771 [Vanrija pseudolonga]